MLSRYPSLSSDWLLFGKGNPFRDQVNGDISDSAMDLFSSPGNARQESQDSERTPVQAVSGAEEKEIQKILSRKSPASGTVRIICFYPDNTFIEYFPHHD
jgi:hypothetical protein